MNELQAVTDAYRQAHARGERAALATVVNVIGSAYRRPGARMLITESGQTAGSISGGCLEHDIAARAARVMASRASTIVEYDTRGEEDIIWGLGLGCNGVVQILLESLHEGSDGAQALHFIADCQNQRKRGLLATIIGTDEGEARGEYHIGERLLLDDQLRAVHQPADEHRLFDHIWEVARASYDDEHARIRAFQLGAEQVAIFFDVVVPPLPLVIFGAELDALPLVRLARMLGWRVTVVDTRARQATPERFSEADEVVLCGAAEAAERIALTPRTSVVVMTHNYLDDVALLGALLPSPVNYLGLLGPRQRTLKLLDELRAAGFDAAFAQVARLRSPIGMDIGAETPEEIALSIIGEIKAVCAKQDGGFLRDRRAPIHNKKYHEASAAEFAAEAIATAQVSASVAVCPSS